MTDQQILNCLEKNYKIRKRRLADALQDGARLANLPVRSIGEPCAICTFVERGGGLFTYHLRNGDELLLGHRCAEYLNYLIAHPDHARHFG
jgi:hypothetical protein